VEASTRPANVSESLFQVLKSANTMWGDTLKASFQRAVIDTNKKRVECCFITKCGVEMDVNLSIPDSYL